MRSKVSRSIIFLKPYLKKNLKKLLYSIFLSVIGSFSLISMTEQIGRTIDYLVTKTQTDFIGLGQKLLLILFSLLVAVSCQWSIMRIGNFFSFQIGAKLRMDLFNHVNQLPVQFFNRQDQGDLLQRLTNDIEQITSMLNNLFTQVFSNLSLIVILIIFMLKLNLVLAGIVLFMTPLTMLSNWLIVQSSQKHFSKQQAITGNLSSFVNEMVHNQETIIAYQNEAPMYETFKKINAQLFVQGQKAQLSSSLANPVSRFIYHLTYILLGLIGGLLILRAQSNMSIGILASFMIFTIQFTKPWTELANTIPQVQVGFASCQRVQRLLNIAIEPIDTKNTPPLTITKGEVQFQQVTFGYNPEKPVIQDFTLHIKAGETVAIVGKTGSGKTTLVNLLLRFYECQSGKIMIDGKSITNFSRDSLRKKWGTVLQDTWFSDGTLKDNLFYGNPQVTKSESQTVLDKIGLASKIATLPLELDTPMNQVKQLFSEGELQLLSIARVMLCHPTMLILDEATSAVDVLTENNIQRALTSLMEGRTTFVIAHRLTTVQKADKIIVMENGKIVESGNHLTLLKNKGAYYQLNQAHIEQ